MQQLKTLQNLVQLKMMYMHAQVCAKACAVVQTLVHYMHEWLVLHKLLQTDVNQRMCAQEHVLQKL